MHYRVNRDAVPAESWPDFLRARDLIQIFDSTESSALKSPVLEIGSGNGFLTTLLRDRFSEVVAVDPQPRSEIPGIVRARAEELPFEDGHFQLVISSNVLEHVTDLPAALAEMRRVSAPDAMFVHTMPTIAWKVTQCMTHSPNAVARAVGKRFVSGRRPWADQGVERGSERAIVVPPGRGISSKIARALLPPVHGVGASHIDEFKRFRHRAWVSVFEANDFDVIATQRLFWHSPYRMFPYRALWLREMISRWLVSSVEAYWLKAR